MPNIMTVEQMQKGSLNLDTLEAWVEGAPNTTVTTPNGRVVPTMSTAVAKLTTDGIMQDNKTQRQINAELVTTVNSVSGGYFKAFDTLANLQAATGMTTGQVAKVMNDSTTSNNGDYYYNGTSWVKGYDALTDAKTYTDSYATVKAKLLTASDNLNSITKQGNYIAYGINVAATDRNYPTNRGGHLRVDFVVTGSTGTIAFQTFQNDTGEIYQRCTKSDGSAWLPWQQIVSKTILNNAISTSKEVTNLTPDNNTDLNTLTSQGSYAVYSTNNVSVSHFPKQSTFGFLLVYTLNNVTNQLFLERGTNNVYVRNYWGTDGWSAWDKLTTSTDVNNSINASIAALNISKFDNLTYNQTLDEMLRNPLKSTRIKLIGDSITWGMGSSATSPIEPRNGTLSDVRNTTDPSSKTWANLLRQWIAKVYGNGSIVEDKAGSAYTQKTMTVGWRDIYKQVKMTNPLGTVLTDAQKLTVLDTNLSFSETGTSFNLINASYGETKRPYSMEFDVVADNLTIIYQSQQVGDANDIVEIYVDGTLVDSFNYYAASNYSASKTINFTHGKHTIKLINKSTYASSYVRIGGFKIAKKSWVINEGIIGSSTATWLNRNLFNGTLDGTDDVILMMLGTNDRGESGGVDGFRKRLNDCIDKINTLSPSSKVILMSSTFANTDAPTSPYKFDMGVVDKIIASVAKERGLIFISNYKAVAQAFVDGENPLSDGLHLNELGNKYYYQNIRKKLFDY